MSTSTSGSGPRARVMIERCGCSSAWAAVRRPCRRSSSTSEWSDVSRRSCPSRKTWARLSSLPVSSAAVSVVPMPERVESRWERSWMRRLASITISRRNVSGGTLGSISVGSNDSAAIFEATSPAWAPPIPSATAKSGERTNSESSLALRWRPVSERYACSATVSMLTPPARRARSEARCRRSGSRRGR